MSLQGHRTNTIPQTKKEKILHQFQGKAFMRKPAPNVAVGADRLNVTIHSICLLLGRESVI